MTIARANSERGFTRDEVVSGKPPVPPHPPTKRGEAAAFNNQGIGGAHRPCETCGDNTLVLRS
jgi:hypothetical protein